MKKSKYMILRKDGSVKEVDLREQKYVPKHPTKDEISWIEHVAQEMQQVNETSDQASQVFSNP